MERMSVWKLDEQARWTDAYIAHAVRKYATPTQHTQQSTQRTTQKRSFRLHLVRPRTPHYAKCANLPTRRCRFESPRTFLYVRFATAGGMHSREMRENDSFCTTHMFGTDCSQVNLPTEGCRMPPRGIRELIACRNRLSYRLMRSN